MFVGIETGDKKRLVHLFVRRDLEQRFGNDVDSWKQTEFEPMVDDVICCKVGGWMFVGIETGDKKRLVLPALQTITGERPMSKLQIRDLLYKPNSYLTDWCYRSS